MNFESQKVFFLYLLCDVDSSVGFNSLFANRDKRKLNYLICYSLLMLFSLLTLYKFLPVGFNSLFANRETCEIVPGSGY